MQENQARPNGLRRRVAERWTPLFGVETAIAPVTVEELESACGWSALRAAGAVTPDETPLTVAGLRLSTIFPRHLLRYRDDGRLVPIAFVDAVALVRLTLAQSGRCSDHVATAVVAPSGAVAALPEGDNDDEPVSGVESEPEGGRRRFFRRNN